MGYDFLFVEGSLSRLTAGSLLAKRNLKVAVIEKSYSPGGSCGVFKRVHVTFNLERRGFTPTGYEVSV